MSAAPAQGPAVPALRTSTPPARSARRPIGRGPRAIVHTDPASVRTSRRLFAAPRRSPAMKRTTFYAALVGAFLVSAAAMGISATVDSPRSLMSPTDFDEARHAIESDAKLAYARCRDEDGQARDVCKAEARANERVRKADLEARYRGTVSAAADAKLARAKAAYEVARAKCGAEHGEQRLACLRAARTEKAKALGEAKIASTT